MQCCLQENPDLVEIHLAGNPVTLEGGECPTYHIDILVEMPNLELVDGVSHIILLHWSLSLYVSGGWDRALGDVSNSYSQIVSSWRNWLKTLYSTVFPGVGFGNSK